MAEIRQIQVDGINYDLVISEDEVSATAAAQSAAQAAQSASQANTYKNQAANSAQQAATLLNGMPGMFFISSEDGHLRMTNVDGFDRDFSIRRSDGHLLVSFA